MWTMMVRLIQLRENRMALKYRVIGPKGIMYRSNSLDSVITFWIELPYGSKVQEAEGTRWRTMYDSCQTKPHYRIHGKDNL